jgi:protein SCO1
MMLVVSIMVLFPGYAGAAQRLHGVVLALTPKSGQAIVRHDAFGSMPAMTMPFRIVPRERAAQLQAGATIDADVDTATAPWTLSHVTSTSAQSLTSEAGLYRRVRPLEPGDPVPDTAFVDQNGKPFRFADLRGQDVVLSFVYTRCADARMCPLISGEFGRLQRTLGTRKVHLVEVTLDPAYDRPAVLRRYGEAFGADPKRWSLVVGDAEPTLDFAARFGIGTFPDPAVGIIHSENTALIAPDGRIRQFITETSWDPAQLIASIDAEHGRAADPLARLTLWLSSAAVAVCGNGVAGFSGLTDLVVVLAIFAAFGYLLYRLARSFFNAAT